MITIVRNIFRACFDKSFYVTSEKDSFGKRYLHLYILFAVVSIILALNIVGFYSQNKTEIAKLPKMVNAQLDTFYPKDLVLKFVNNELSINQPEPYTIGKSLFGNAEQNNSNGVRPQSLITIDTKGSIEDFDSYHSMILAMKKGVAFRQSEQRAGEVRFYSYADFLKEVPQPYSFDSVSYKQIVNKVRPYVNEIPSLAQYGLVVMCILLILLGPVFLSSGILFNLLVLSLLGYLIALAMKRKHSYGYIYKLGMYSSIPVIVLQQINEIVRIPGIDGVWWLIALLIMILFIPQGDSGQAIAGGSTDKLASPMDPPKIV